MVAMDMRGCPKAVRRPRPSGKAHLAWLALGLRRLILYSIVWGLSKSHATCDLSLHSSGQLVRKTSLLCRIHSHASSTACALQLQ